MTLTLNEAMIIADYMIKRNDGTYTKEEGEAIKKLLHNGEMTLNRLNKKKEYDRTSLYKSECIVCGKEFIAKARGAHYCSQSCRNKNWYQKLKNDPERLAIRNERKRICKKQREKNLR
jgi:hypothetical protein